MDALQDRILIVENDPAICDQIGRQTLQSVGYQVEFVADASLAIPAIQQMAPDAILLDLHLPGLSAKDFLVALSSQGNEAPVIVLARKGDESNAVQAFRLGACDYLLWPARDAEVLAAVERSLKQMHNRKARSKLANQELTEQIRELTTLCALGKTLTAITDLRQICEKTVEAAVRLIGADAGWLALFDDSRKTFFLAAQRGLPAAMAGRLDQPWEDGLSPLIAQSGESLNMHGDALKKTRAAGLGQAVLLTPLKTKGRATMGVLGIARTTRRPFTAGAQHNLEEIGAYATVALTNARRVYTNQAKAAPAGDETRMAVLQSLVSDVHWFLEFARQSFHSLDHGTVPPEQHQAVLKANEKILQSEKILDLIAVLSQNAAQPPVALDLAGLAQRELPVYQRMARQADAQFCAEIAAGPLPVAVDAALLKAALAGLVSFSLHNNPAHRRLELSVSAHGSRQALIRLSGPTGLTGSAAVAHLFDRPVLAGDLARSSGPQGLSLAGVKEIVSACGGNIQLEPRAGAEPAFLLTLPLC